MSMPDYRYVAIDPQGRERKGRLTAANDDAARADLIRRKFHIVAVEVAGTKPAGRSLLAFRKSKLSSKELALFTRQLATLVEVAPLEEALRTLTRQSRSEEHTSELQSLMRISYAVFCLKKKKKQKK